MAYTNVAVAEKTEEIPIFGLAWDDTYSDRQKKATLQELVDQYNLTSDTKIIPEQRKELLQRSVEYWALHSYFRNAFLNTLEPVKTDHYLQESIESVLKKKLF